MSMTYVSMSAGSLLSHVVLAAGAGFIAGVGAYALYKQMYPDATPAELATFVNQEVAHNKQVLQDIHSKANIIPFMKGAITQ